MRTGIISFLFTSISAQEIIHTSIYKIFSGVVVGSKAAGA